MKRSREKGWEFEEDVVVKESFCFLNCYLLYEILLFII